MRIIIQAAALADLLLKSQLSLFDKVVQVKPSVRADGTVVAAHTAIRHVKRPEAPKAHHPHVADLVEKPKPAQLDMFAEAPKPDTSAEPVKETPKIEHVEPAKKGPREIEDLSDAEYKTVYDAARYLKDVSYSTDVLTGGDKRAMLKLSTEFGKSGRDNLIMDAFNVSRDVAHGINNRLDGAQPRSLREQDMEDAFSMFPKLRGIIDAAMAESAARAAKAAAPTPAPVDESPRKAAGTEPLPTAGGERMFPGLDYSGEGLPPAPAFGVQPGVGKAARRKLNAEAAAMVGDKVDLLSMPKAPDPLVLAQYSGNGGCGDSQNEFYTDPAVAMGMWKALADMGAVGPGATVLEPSCATGVFLATAPAGVKVTGVELDGTSAKIAAALHPDHEIVHSLLESFATSDTRQFDVVIGNAPFGTRGACQKQDKGFGPDKITLHEMYFMDTALDKTKPGGVVAMIVGTALMNTGGQRKNRERLLRKGEFLGAIRMPNTAFEAAHTETTTDILFFRKRPDDVAGALGVVDQDTLKALGVWDEEYLAGSYFEERGADNVLGEVGTTMSSFGERYAVLGSMQGVPEAVAAFKPDSVSKGPDGVAAILEAAPKADANRIRGAAATKPYDGAKRGDVRVINGVRCILEGDPLRWHTLDEFMADQAVVDAGLLGAQIGAALESGESEGLADKVKAYVEKFGIPSRNANLAIAAKQDKNIYRLLGAVKPDGSMSDLVSGKGAVTESSFDAAAQTLALEVGMFTPAMVAGRWHDGTEETILDHLYASPDYALDPMSSAWTSMDAYLTGELWPKLDAVKAHLASDADIKPEDRAKFERQAEALEAAIDPKALEDVELSINSAFIPLDVIAAFFNRPESNYQGKTGDMVVTFDEGIYAYSGGNYNGRLLMKYLNRDGVRKKDDMPTIDRWNKEFGPWLCASPYRDQVEELYNRNFRGFRQKAYSDKPFDVPGLNSLGLKAYQWSGLRWALEAGKGIIAADVGLGKTARALILNKLLKATGRAKKPLIIVPKAVAANWMREAEKWFPGSNVMVIGETYSKDKKTGELKGRADTADERDRKFHDLTQNDYDFVLITQPAWNDLDIDPETRERLQESDFWEQRKKSLEGAKDKKRQAIRDKWDSAKIGEEFTKRTGAIFFNDLGVDAVISDEMHAYKNLFEAKKRFNQSPKFLGGSASSKRAADMRYKMAWLREKTGGNGIYGLTATPTKNSPLEVYSMLSHIAPEAFEKIGIRNSEEFLDRFCVFEERNVLTTTGEMDSALCTVGFKNMDELREIMRRYIDRKTAEDVGLVLPTADLQDHLVDMSAAQKEVYAELRAQAEEAANSKEATGEGHIFSIMARMGKAALDLELYDPVKYAGAKSPKYDELAAKAFAGRAEGGQLVFCDHVDSHAKIVEALVAAGIKRDEIGVINGQVTPSSAKRQNIAEAYRAGKLRVVIGNTATMGEGVDGLQENTTDIHHMDLPWEAATLQQRNGRGRRQGNKAESIRVHSYLGKGTFDGYRYQTVMAKKDWMDALWNGGDKIENLSMAKLERDEMLAMLADDPDAARAKLAANKEAAQARLDAGAYADAHEAFTSYRAKAASLAKLKTADMAKASGQRLKVQVDRARTALEANAYFKPKHLLDAKGDVLLSPTSGQHFEPGVAFKAAADAGVAEGHYVVERVHPSHNLVQVRRWGSTGSDGKLSFELDKLGHGIEPVEHDEAAEKSHQDAAVAESLAAGVSNITKMDQLREMPSSAIKANYAAIQATVKAGLKAHRFTHGGYGSHLGTIKPDGSPAAFVGHSASQVPDDHEIMLPTDEHRALAFDAFHADQGQARFEQDYSSQGGRGRSNSGPRTVQRFPGEWNQSNNRWHGIIESVWGSDAAKEALAASDARHLEAARRAPSMKEAMDLAAKTTMGGQYGSKRPWSRKALATLHAVSKRHGAALDPVQTHYRHAGETFSTGSAHSGTIRSLAHEQFRSALPKMAAELGHPDLAAAMIVDSAETPEHAAAAIVALPESPARTSALQHLVAKTPALADFPAERSMYGGTFRTVGEILGSSNERAA